MGYLDIVMVCTHGDPLATIYLLTYNGNILYNRITCNYHLITCHMEALESTFVLWVIFSMKEAITQIIGSMCEPTILHKISKQYIQNINK